MYRRYQPENVIEMNIHHSRIGSSSDPNIFGPAMWFTFHNSALMYPKNPTRFVQNGMKQILINLPLLIPCLNCGEHFHSYLNTVNLDQVVSSREALFAFWVEAHNFVNSRYGKRIVSLQEAKNFYGFNRPEIGSMMRINYS